MFSLLLCLAGNITPIITSSSNEKIKAIQEKISDKVRGLNYKTDDQAAKIKEITNKNVIPTNAMDLVLGTRLVHSGSPLETEFTETVDWIEIAA